MANKHIDITIGSKLIKTGFDAAVSHLKSFTSRVGSFAKGIGSNLMNIKAGFDLAAAGVAKFTSLLAKGMEFERLTVQFKSLTGSMATAKAHMQDLDELAKTPPFNTEQFAAASREMMKMTDGMAGYKKEMLIVGDIAAATGNDIAQVGRAFGLAYQVIRDGQSFGRAGMQLYSLGILTKKQVEDFDALSQSGASNIEVWNKLVTAFSKYNGAMADTETTTRGLIDAIKEEGDDALEEFSIAISESAKPALDGLLGSMRSMREDGSIEDWAEGAASAIVTVAEKISEAIQGFKALGSAAVWLYEKSGVSDLWHGANSIVQGAAGAIGTLAGGGSLKDASISWNEDSAAEITKGFYGRKAAKAGLFGQDLQDAINAEDLAAENAPAAREERRAERKRKREEQAAKLKAESEAKMVDDMERAQAETDAKNAAKKAKVDADLAKKAEDERVKAVAAEKKAREAMEAELHKQRTDNLKAEIESAKGAAAGVSGVAQSAQTEFDRAFAMYRDPALAASSIAEERDYSADYKQLGKDANRYGGSWRINELASLMASGDTAGQAAKLEEWRKSSKFTPEVEAMVRASAADKTKTTAEDELRKINANTANLDKKLDELLSMK